MMERFYRTRRQRSVAVLSVLAIALAGPDGLLSPPPAFAQEAQPAPLAAAQLDNVVARIALYPDSLLAQVLAASTYPGDIPEALQWSTQHQNLKGDALAQTMQHADLSWDPSVQALIPFPTVLQMLANDMAWTTQLGNAVLVQRGDVMDAIQRMRKKAYDAGNLKSTDQVKVVQTGSPQVIEIQPPSPTVIYVPTYNPQVVYAPPPPGPSTGTVAAAAIIGFTAGAVLSAAFCDSWWGYHGGFYWGSHTVVVHNAAWGRSWVNRTAYVHRWGGYNANYYARHTNYYARRNVAVNRPVNVNVNRPTNVNVNRPTNVNVNRPTNVNTNRATTYNRSQSVNAPSQNNVNRGYSVDRAAGRSSAYSGVQSGRAERAAAQRGRVSRRR